MDYKCTALDISDFGKMVVVVTPTKQCFWRGSSCFIENERIDPCVIHIYAGDVIMYKMQEEEFDAIVIDESTSNCPPHEVVKLYYLGTHSDYGCVKCKMKSLRLEDFQ